MFEQTNPHKRGGCRIRVIDTALTVAAIAAFVIFTLAMIRFADLLIGSAT